MSMLQRIAHFLFEVGMLKKTPRTGYQFLGSGQENVAEHSFRTAIIGYILAKRSKADIARTTFLCLFHDVHEARTGDFNYVNKIYNTCNDKAALHDALAGTGLEADVTGYYEELTGQKTLEARLANDADQLDLICNLKEQLDLGNLYAQKWLDCAIKRLQTPAGIEIGQEILRTDQSDWWFSQQTQDWWITGKKT